MNVTAGFDLAQVRDGHQIRSRRDGCHGIRQSVKQKVERFGKSSALKPFARRPRACTLENVVDLEIPPCRRDCLKAQRQRCNLDFLSDTVSP